MDDELARPRDRADDGVYFLLSSPLLSSPLLDE
jgi:hypothetical protein